MRIALPPRAAVVKGTLLALCALAALFALGTLIALEGQEVVVLRTSGTHGHARETRTWIAEHEGTLWIEAANPEREFYHHIMANPQVELKRGGEWRHCRAAPVAAPDGHDLIRGLLSRKYGWADRWIGMIADTSRSIAIRVECPSSP